ncbi:hypothetical protein D3C72_1786470 [compost metagenome]
MTDVAAIISAFVTVACVFVVTLILQGKAQAIHQSVEVGVAIGGNAVSAAGHVDVGLGIRIAAELRQHIGPAFHVIQHAIVTAIIK